MAVIYSDKRSGGILVQDDSDVSFGHAPGYVDNNLNFFWDLDDDGDLDEPEENITSYITSADCVTGRSTGSQLFGQVSPGRFRAVLNNQDDRFGYFNQNSPLNTHPFAIKQGSLLRVQTSTASGSDPTLLACDRFYGDGNLGIDELGNPWIATVGMSKSGGRAYAAREAQTPRIDLGVDDCYMQIQITERHLPSIVGLTYRVNQSTGEFGTVYFSHNASNTDNLVVADVDGATFTQKGVVFVESIDGRFIGAHIHGSTVDLYLDGVYEGSYDAGDADGQEFGLFYYQYPAYRRSIGEIKIWDKPPDQITGCIFTGRVTGFHPSVSHKTKTVEMTAEGSLSIAAQANIETIPTIGERTGVSSGLRSGHLVGNSLLKAGIPHLTTISSDIIIGAQTNEEKPALEAARLAESIEFGRVYETPEGYIGFHSRSDRDTGTLYSSWTDHPESSGQFVAEDIRIKDWRNEKRNRVSSGVAPQLPRIVGVTEASGVAAPPFQVQSRAYLSGLSVWEPDDLVLAIFWGSNTGETEDWLEPAGWRNIRQDKKGGDGKFKVYGRIVKSEDIALGADTTLYDNASGFGGCTWQNLILIRNFYGSLAEGIHVSSEGFHAPEMVAAAIHGRIDLPAVGPPWGGVPTLHIRAQGGVNASTTGSPTKDPLLTGQGPYRSVVEYYFELAGTDRVDDIAVARAYRNSSESRLDENRFHHNQGGFDFIETVDIMVRGYTGAGTDKKYLTVTTDDPISQAQTGGVLSYELAGTSFGSEADAEAYNNIVLAKYAKDNPVISLRFTANKSAAYKQQAVQRRVGDRLFVDCTGQTGLGLYGEYVIESIYHNWSRGNKRWQVEWQLSPV